MRGLFWSFSDNKNSPYKSFISVIEESFSLIGKWLAFLVLSEYNGASLSTYTEVDQPSKKITLCYDSFQNDLIGLSPAICMWSIGKHIYLSPISTILFPYSSLADVWAVHFPRVNQISVNCGSPTTMNIC